MDIQGSYLSFLDASPSISFDTGAFIAMLILIACSAFFSMSETAFSSLSITKVKLAVEDRRAGAKKALQLSEKFERTLTTLLVGNNIVNTAISVIAVGFFSKLILDTRWVELVSTAVITVALLIFGEIMPKTIAKQHSEGIALKVAWPVYIISCILYPIILFFQLLQHAFTKNKADDTMDEDELQITLKSMASDGELEENEVSLIRHVLELNDRTVADIMVPRVDMFALDNELSTLEVKKLLRNSRYSRIPVFDGDKDNIIGVLFEREFFKILSDAKDMNFDWHKLIRKTKFVSKSMKIDSLITFLRAEKSHMAIVVGEFDDTVGLVTMEDALEEIVGEIYDESDVAGLNDLFFEQEEDGSYIVDADIYVTDLFERLNVGSAPKDVPSKLYSWFFEHCESIPAVGMQMSYVTTYAILNEEEDEYEDYIKRLVFTIHSVDGRRIEKVKIEILDATEEELEAQQEEEED